MRFRREQVLAMLMEHLSEEQIGQRLAISQSSVSRDLKRLDADAQQLKEDLATTRLADNAIWKLFSQLDAAASQVLKEFDGNKHADPKNRLTELNLLLDLLYRKCYLLKFVAIDAPSPTLPFSTSQTLTKQYWELGVRLQILEEHFSGKVEQQV